MHSVTNPPTKSHIQPTLPSIFSHSSPYSHSLISLFHTTIRIPSLTRFNPPYLHTFIYPHSVSCNFSFTPTFKLHYKPRTFCCFTKQNYCDILILIIVQFINRLIHIRQQRYGPDIFITDSVHLGPFLTQITFLFYPPTSFTQDLFLISHKNKKIAGT
jgi:hypothetical protein